MDSFKEKDKLAPKPSKRPCIEAAEELMRQMIAGQAPLDSKVVRRIPDPEEKNTDAPEENTSETVSEASAPTTEKQTSTPKRLLERSLPASVVKSSRCRTSNAPSSHRWIAVTVRRSMSAPKPSTKYRKSSTCWETIIQD